MNLLRSHVTTLNNSELNWQQLQPNAITYSFSHITADKNLLTLQPHLAESLALFCRKKSSTINYPFMLVKGNNNTDYFSLLQNAILQQTSDCEEIKGYQYHIYQEKIQLSQAKTKQDNFAATSSCLFANWFESEQLLGYFRQHEEYFSLHAGLIHKANGGILILPLQAFLNQPWLWLRFKQIVQMGQHDWLSDNTHQSLPYFIPPMQIDLKVILVGNRDDLSDFQLIEPDLYQHALYAEFESEFIINNESDVNAWAAYTKGIAKHYQLPEIDHSCYPALIKTAVKYTEDQYRLPLCPSWIKQQWINSAFFAKDHIDETAFNAALHAKIQRESYLPNSLFEEIHQGQIKIDTQDAVIGQVNGLSVIEYPGHPCLIGLPSRISCVLRQGNGEITDIEQRAELSGNIHIKSIMIMQSFIAHELSLEQELPYSASVAFEQSYSEIDGDSASLASLCAFISALSLLPADQQIAITGSVDQFGNVQPIGGINEKIEGFFDICQNRTLTGKQGVILPQSNIRHLCLRDDIVEAVKNNQFHLWSVEHAYNAFELLLNHPYKSDSDCILRRLQLRIKKQQTDNRSGLALLKWLVRSK